MHILRLIVLGALAVCVLHTGTARAERFLSAMDIFARLPVTFFEDTAEGLSEEERDQLVSTGRCPYWQVISESSDSLVLASRPFGETEVTLRVFRGGDHDFVAAIGTSATPMCALELWGLGSAGGLVPVSTPPDPPLSDYLTKNPRLPRDVSPAIVFCLNADGLETRPLFWGPEGLLNIPLDRRVDFVWQHGAFKKVMTPLQKLAIPEAAGKKVAR